MKSYKNILFQFLAGLCLLLGCKQLFFLGNIELLELISSMGKESFTYFANKSDRFGISTQLQKLLQIKIILGFVAIGINYIILFVIAYKKKTDWNIPIIISFVLGLIHYFNWIEISPISIQSIALVGAYLIPIILLIVLAIAFYTITYRTSSK